nr:hypothetical protein [Marispirochaeta sp.]
MTGTEIGMLQGLFPRQRGLVIIRVLLIGDIVVREDGSLKGLFRREPQGPAAVGFWVVHIEAVAFFEETQIPRLRAGAVISIKEPVPSL